MDRCPHWLRGLGPSGLSAGERRHLPCTSIAVEGKDALQVVYFTTRDGTLQVRPPCCHLQRSGLSCTWALDSVGRCRQRREGCMARQS